MMLYLKVEGLDINMKPIEISKIIKETFTPFAFQCSCNGSHEDCKNAQSDVHTFAQNETVERIVKFLKNLDS